jgi:hypothetical protein
MSVRLLLTEEAWAEIAPILAAIKSHAGSPPVLSDRMFGLDHGVGHPSGFKTRYNITAPEDSFVLTEPY